jgi:N-acetylmuramoyl-L-alanine amidase
MVSSSAVTRTSLAGALLALVALPRLAAQEVPEGPGTEAPVAVVATGTGRLASGGSEAPLPWIETAEGVLVALEPIVARLGGELVVGPLGASYELRLAEGSYLLAPGSPALTRGGEIVALAQPPALFLNLLYVPVDLLEKSWGEAQGVAVRWEREARRLAVDRPAARAHPVEVSVVHLQGVSTVVLRFPQAPRVRIAKTAEGWEVVGLGDRFVAPPPRRIDDPYVRAVEVAAERIRLVVVPGLDGEPYRLKGPDRIVFDLFPRRAAPAAAPEPPPAAAPRGITTVVVDPGHGGSETGAIGPSGTMEKELTLLLARALAERLAAALGVRVALTRTDDVDVALDDRTAFANQNRADLFLSLHLNSAARAEARGAETYFLSLQASDALAADAAQFENVVGEAPAEPGSDQFDLQLLLWDLAQSQHLAASQRLATLIQEELNRQLDLPDRGVKQAPFRVLMGAAMPAVLVELGFLSSPAEEQRLRDPAYRAELVQALVRAISRFRSESEARSGAAGAPR